MSVCVFERHRVDARLLDRIGNLKIRIGVGFGVIFAIEFVGVTAAHMHAAFNLVGAAMKRTLKIIFGVDAIAISKATVRNIKQNLFGAFIYNTLGIPIAAGLLYPLMGILLNPMIAGGAMALSSLTVVSNANRLRLLKPGRRRIRDWHRHRCGNRKCGYHLDAGFDT